MGRKRSQNNPFRACGTVHSLLGMLYARTEKLYSVRDPRVGAKLGTFLYRLGLYYLFPMFPPKEFSSVQDLKDVHMDLLTELYQDWQYAEEKKGKQHGNKAKKVRGLCLGDLKV